MGNVGDDALIGIIGPFGERALQCVGNEGVTTPEPPSKGDLRKGQGKQ